MQGTPTRYFLLTSVVVAVCVVGAAAHAETPSARTAVLVELFTSEGCSSCPPADALLARLQREQPVPGADILVMEEHVDYWDALGWRDRFSSHQFTERQSAYAQRFRTDGPYTPQMVVDGADQFVGNDAAHVMRAIAQAARAPKLTLELSPIVVRGRQVVGQVSAAPAGAALPPADLYAVLVESTASTQVQHGENGGRTLQHVSIVRAMQRVGSLNGLTHGPVSFALTVPQDTPAANFSVILFAQRLGEGAVVSAIRADISQTDAHQIAGR
jgi:hypothetical protein